MGRLNEAAEKLSWFYPKLLLLFLLAVVALTSGCAALATLPISSLVGSPNSQSMNIYGTTEIRIQQKNFMVMKTNVVGESKGFSLFGVVTIVPARVSKAMNRLYAKADMQQGRAQTLANLSME